MPSPAEILSGLERPANAAYPYAIVWHVAVGCVLLLLVLGWRPTPRIAGLLSTVPLMSVSALTWVYGNPFNAIVFAFASIVLVVLALRAPAAARTARHETWSAVLGGSLVAFAWTYPHFLTGQPWYAYLYAAPMGLIPCPTLALIVGVSLVGNGPAGRTWTAALAAIATFYGLFGVLRLGVIIDLVLLVGALGLFAQDYVSVHSGARRQAPLTS
jgi:sulfite exporter TauE/SafE